VLRRRRAGRRLRHRAPGAQPGHAVLAAEPAGYDDTKLSLEAGRRLGHGATAPTICDAIMTSIPGELTFEVNSRLLAGGLAASDDEVREAMRLAFRHLRLVVEPGGAVALAVALAHGRRLPGAGGEGAAVAVVLSGGNVDPGLFADVLRGG
jgi:threonine dehydratase